MSNDGKVPVTVRKFVGRKQVSETTYVTPDHPLAQRRKLVVPVSALEALADQYARIGENCRYLAANPYDPGDEKEYTSRANAFALCEQRLRETIESEQYDS